MRSDETCVKVGYEEGVKGTNPYHHYFTSSGHDRYILNTTTTIPFPPIGTPFDICYSLL